jgi:hypothetical protein
MLSRDFKEFVALLNAHGAEYLVVGGYAMAVHGRPRQTGDLDIWLKRDHDNALRVMAALEDFGFGGLDALKANKRASGRPRDLDDLEHLP